MNAWSPIEGITFYLGGENGKARFVDPDNLFHTNLNVAPDMQRGRATQVPVRIFGSCRALRTSSKICRTMSISSKLVRRPNETPNGAGSNKEADDAGYGVRESH